jgi:hypothetical protein
MTIKAVYSKVIFRRFIAFFLIPAIDIRTKLKTYGQVYMYFLDFIRPPWEHTRKSAPPSYEERPNHYAKYVMSNTASMLFV